MYIYIYVHIYIYAYKQVIYHHVISTVPKYMSYPKVIVVITGGHIVFMIICIFYPSYFCKI